MENNPRKIRLLVKGKGKLDSLFHRRKKPKKEEDSSQATGHDSNPDIEDDTPILSRIKDPSQFAAPQIVRLKLIPPQPNGINPTSQHNGNGNDQLDNSIQDNKEEQDENVNEEVSGEQAIKSQRRRGILGIEELRNQTHPETVFKTNTVMLGNTPVAMQPSASITPNTFTFNMQNGTPTFCPFRGLGTQAPKVQPSNPQIQQAARNTFLKSNPEPETLPQESFESTKPGISIQNIQEPIKASPSKAKTKTKTKTKNARPVKPQPTYDFLTQPMQTPTKDDPLGYLKLSTASKLQKPTINKASLLANVSDFVRSEIEAPLPGPEIYRDGRHKPPLPKDMFVNSIPDGLEITKFVFETGRDCEIPQITKHGDVPALTSIKGERIPVRTSFGPQMTKAVRTRAETSINEELVFDAGATSLPPHAATRAKLQSVPDTHYTAPDRLISAVEFARSQLSLSSRSRGVKRKRGEITLPPPSYVHQRTNNPNFNIFTNGILCYPELTLLFASHLPVQTLINLYSVSKDFHIIVNQRFTTIVLNQLRIKAPCAAKCYPWRCYAHLSQPDPSLSAQNAPLGHTGEVVNIRPAAGPASPFTQRRLKQKTGKNNNNNNANSTFTGLSTVGKKVPTFRYLRMAIHREKVIHELYALFAEQGVPLPGCPATYVPEEHEHASLRANQGFATALHKLWFVFDIPDNGRRFGYIQTPTLFTNTDLLYGLTFLVKLDMVLHDPLAGEKRDSMRKLLLSARDGFDTLLRLLKRDPAIGRSGGGGWNNELDALRSWARYGLYLPEDGMERAIGGGMIPFNLTPKQHAECTSLFGIPRDEIGLLKREFWGALDMYQRGGDTKTNKNTGGSSGGRAKSGQNTNTPRRRVIGRTPGYLMRIDQLLVRETLRRKMAMNKQFLRAMLHGYIDPATLERIPVREYGRRSDVLEEMGEYDVDHNVEGLAGGLGALGLEEGGDALLDLGRKQSEIGSVLMVKRRGVGKKEMAERKKAEETRKGMYDAWKAEVQEEKEEEERRRRRLLSGGVFGDQGADNDDGDGFLW